MNITVGHISSLSPSREVDVGSTLLEVLKEIRALREEFQGAKKPWLTVNEVARLTGRAAYTIRRWIKEGRIKAIRLDGTGPRGRLLIGQQEIDRIIEGGLGSEI